ncbi:MULTISPECIES: 3-phosphoshikimate 1-carboxyvinyltransferase [Flavobacterium]|uniref:3-phosphoshikimate 1-carboxyvinyltransferase n=2 Tax=Flavobacterium TaxID=237 RepID=A0A246GK34_9FLAO|nr:MULTISPECIES: 3-phosphoshikimate 1-carboxyvinyltransferase [Flavobacterium]OWP84657.1 3-phosphoshikimate 1-carboxyvinyltransferase [Flavobacterium davisii]RVU89772.1 3-phosphoshikimate 1-carboxyvinyltransferase [Flavobacterium columnare]
MEIKLRKSVVNNQQKTIKITGSKSETNRLLLLQALYPSIIVENTSNSDDSDVMQKALNELTEKSVDVHHAGTAMRFLTAFFAIQEGKEMILTGSSRMKERPIKILVEALQQLGVEISYLEKEGFPPIKIKGRKIKKNQVALPANVSSQYISALLLIAPKLEEGLVLHLEGQITSIPYIKMTLSLLNEMGIQTSFEENIIKVNSNFKLQTSNFIVESDWSSASYWYSIIALSELGTQLTLSSYKKNSLQGDAALVKIYQYFGVETLFNDNSIILTKKTPHAAFISLDLNNCPDIAQTITVTCLGLRVRCDLYGLHTLKIKETDRLEALKIELTKLGADIIITDESLHLKPPTIINENVIIKTYQDHRMAMAFAPLALQVPIIIEEAEVVSKSYPDFWNDLATVGFCYTSV